MTRFVFSRDLPDKVGGGDHTAVLFVDMESRTLQRSGWLAANLLMAAEPVIDAVRRSDLGTRASAAIRSTAVRVPIGALRHHEPSLRAVASVRRHGG